MSTIHSSARQPEPVQRPTEALRLAAIDVGSNSIHMIVAQIDADGAVTTLWRMKEMVGLGRASFPSRKLSEESMQRAIQAMVRFKQAAMQRQCEKIVAVATSAVREAENGGDFIERVRDETGQFIRVVSAREEARLIYLAVRHALPLEDKPHLIVDIGGGSVEFIVGDERRAAILESRKLGAARMTAQFVKSDPISDTDREALLKHYEQAIDPLAIAIRSVKPVRCIGTSGTLENLAAMCGTGSLEGDGESVAGHIDRTKFEKLLDDLLESTSKTRARMRGLDDQRKDQVLAGALLVDQLFKRLDLKRIDLCGSALREGILLDYLARHVPEMTIRRDIPDPRRRGVIDLARRCDWHQTHSEHVARLCLRLFDDLKPLHGLGPIERELIDYGALLHDIGWHISRDQHHKHGQYLILNGKLKNFTDEEVNVIACICRYHRKRPPTKRHKTYAMLSLKMRRVVDVGSALLRIADGLDRSHSSSVSDVRCRIEDKRVHVSLTPRYDAELELWGARRKRSWFEQVFKTPVVFDLRSRSKDTQE